MDNNNETNQLINIKHYISKTLQNKKTNKFKQIKLKFNNKSINFIKKKTKSNNNLYTNKNKAKPNSFKNNYINYIKFSDKDIKKELQKRKLDSINLIEKNTKNIYNWNILLSNPNLGLYYNKKEYKKLEESTEKNEPKNKFPNYPVVLVDLSENELKKFFGKKSGIKYFSHFKKSINNLNSPLNSINSLTINEENSNIEFTQRRLITEINNEVKDKKAISHNIRPISIYSARKPEEIFYFSNDFSDYYKEDLKTFSKKMPLLKPRILTSNKKLKKEIYRQRIKSSKEEKKLINVINNVENGKIKFKKLDLIIAGERKNVEPLLKNIYQQENPDSKKISEHVKMYYKTMKPFGNNKENIDFTKNERWQPSNEIKNLREKYNKKINDVGTNTDSNYLNDNSDYYAKNNKKRNLILSYYNKNDPYIKFFNSLINKHNEKTLNNYNEIYSYNNINDEENKEKIIFSTLPNKKNKNYKKELMDKEYYKFPILTEQNIQYSKFNVENNQEEKEKN